MIQRIDQIISSSAHSKPSEKQKEASETEKGDRARAAAAYLHNPVATPVPCF
jgi:hypothetical protein